jgi:starch synthase
MKNKKLKIVSISAEIAPFSKTGGLGDVANNLPKAIKKMGHEIIAITPLYEQVIDKKKYKLKLAYGDINVYLNSKESVKINYWKGYLKKGLPVYFIENKKYFSKKKTLYGSSHENARFLVFDVAALKLISLLKYSADIVHCHDWHTGLIPFYLKTDFRYSKTLAKAKTIYTIHNLTFQFGRNWWEIPSEKKDNGRKRIPHLSNPDIEYLNFAKRAILSADVINTVSEQYREEILTKNFGEDLHRILKNREDRLFGIINGIDYNEYNPATDPGLYRKYSIDKISDRVLNKKHIQKKFCLSVKPKTPLICVTSRVTFQKGFELILKILNPLLEQNIAVIIMGSGDKNYIKEVNMASKKYPKKIVFLPFDDKTQKYETLLYAGSDMFLLPSYKEPCGINQLKAMRYGCIPIVRKIGGLHDTVMNYDTKKNKGTGFSFNDFSESSLFETILRAIEVYKDKNKWNNLIIKAMQKSSSWEIPAQKYVALYRKAMKINNKNF